MGLTKIRKTLISLACLLQKCACANMLNESTIKLQSGSEVPFRTQRFPSPTDDNGWVMVNERIEPKWYEGESLPPQLVDILQDYNDEDETDSGSHAEQFSDRMEAIVTVAMIKK